MRFTLGRAVHFYYVTLLLGMVGLFSYGAKYYWDSGLLNIDYVSNLYDGTNKVKTVKERNDIEELKKMIDGDRIRDANKIYARLDADVKDLKAIKALDKKSNFDENFRQVKASLIGFQSAPELSVILNSLNGKVANFENFAGEKKWPTLTKMSMNLRLKLSPNRLLTGGLYSFERTQNLALSVNNDLEAMINFTESSGLQIEIKNAIINRIKTIKHEAANLTAYVDAHAKFNRLYKELHADYITWFKLVEPEIAFKKIQFEKNSQTIFYSLIGIFAGLVGSLILGIGIYNFSASRSSKKTEKLIIDTIKDGLLPIESKMTTQFSPGFNLDFEKYREYAHKRMAFGAIFQDAVPFATILLDSNLNMLWGNTHFYDQWELKNFKEDQETLSWDFLQKFTNLKDNGPILSALRMSVSGQYKIEVKSNTMASALPYEMFISPVEYSDQKRIMIIFYPLLNSEEKNKQQKNAMINPLLKILELQMDEKLTTELKNELRLCANEAGSGELFSKMCQYIDKTESIQDELNQEIELLEVKASEQRSIAGEIRKSLVHSFETQRSSIERYGHFKTSVASVVDSRDQLEEQLKYAMNSSRELYKDQAKILTAAEKAEKNVDEYIKSLKTITVLKNDFKDLKSTVEDFKAKIVQVLDQLLIFQSHENDTQRVDQFLGKIKIDMKGFEKVLHNFGEVVTQLDVTVTKVDMMVESREKIDLDGIKYRLETIKNNLENIQFSTSKISQSSHSKDDEMVNNLKFLVGNLKIEMKRINEMCRLTGMNSEHMDVITSNANLENQV